MPTLCCGTSMTDTNTAVREGFLDRAGRIAPGLPALLHYNRSDLSHDLLAGLSVAAVALPVAVAYAVLAGFNPVVGLYSSILPLVAYALFGTSRQLIVGPDAATCAIVAASVAPLAGGNPETYWSLSVMLAFLAGLLCIGASFLRLGALADFLSRPILLGLLHGVAISIVLGQISRLFGFPIEAHGIIPRFIEFASKLGETHWPTLAVALATFVVLVMTPRLVPNLPAALVAMTGAALAVAGLGLENVGVMTVGAVPAGLPPLRLPRVAPGDLSPLLANAAAVALVSFSSGMLTARSFAERNGYEIDVDREFAALGAANVVSALSQGFAVSGADSRTAMNDSVGGRTQVAGIVAAGAIALVLLFLTIPLQYVPMAALGAVLVGAALSLIDIGALRELYRLEKAEFALAIATMLAIVVLSVMEAIFFAVVLALLRFIRLTARPHDEILGKVDGEPGLHGVKRHEHARTIPGLVLYRFNGPLLFFNANYFKQRVLAMATAAGPGLRWFVVDALPITMMDVTGYYALRKVDREFAARNIVFGIAGRMGELAESRIKKGILHEEQLKARLFPTLRQALKAFQEGGRNEKPQAHDLPPG
jgi:high affinity sulfate transporter 1